MSSSFLVKQGLVGKAIDRQDPRSLQPAYVVAWAVRDSCVTQIIGALRGLIATLLNAAFVIAGGGMLLHFPQRRHVLAAFGQEF